MVKFGHYLKTHLNEDWKEHYIDYDHLKSKIKEIKLILQKDLANFHSREEENQYLSVNLKADDNLKNVLIEKKENTNQVLKEDFENEKKNKPDKKIIERKRVNVPNYIIYEQKLIEKTRMETKNFKDKMKEDVLIGRKCINISDYVHDFLCSVDEEIKKFYNFFKKLEKDLKSNLNSILIRELTFYNISLTQISDEIIFLENLSKFTLEISYFININITAIRKILKKFDKTFGITKNPVAVYYLKEIFQNKSTSLNYILQFKIIDESSALIEKLSNDLECSLEKRISHSGFDETFNEPLLFKNLDIEIDKLTHLKIEGILKTFKKKFNKLHKKVEKIDNANNLIRTSVEIWTLMMKSNMRVVDDYFAVRETKHIKYGNEVKDDLIEKLTPQVDREQEIKLDFKSMQNIWITLIHTFLYMVNSYIIQPTNALFVQDLGASPMLSGVIMGMTPFAAIFCTLLYSKWTNTSYKLPLLFSCISFFLGNIMYAFADFFRSLFFMGLGRFFIGLASARVVNRRYLIEKIPHELILHYSLLYVVLTCMGMAGGPFLAIFVMYIPDYEYFFLRFNKFTNPAWVCSVLWLIFGIYISGAFIDNLQIRPCDREEKTSLEIDMTDKVTNSVISVSVDNHMNSRIINPKFGNPIESERSVNVSSNLIEYDIQNLIREQETTFSYMSISFLLLVIILFLIRMTTESFLVLTPIYMPATFNISSMGLSIFLFLTSFIVFPISYVINHYSKSHPERKIIFILLISCTISCLFLVNIPGFMNATLIKFILFYTILFVCCNILESVDSALMAKIFPANLNIGICNSGFTIIMGTTGGRFIGSIIITIFGLILSRDLVFDFLISFYLIAFTIVTYFVYRNYSDLRVKAIARIIQKKEM